MSYGHVYMCLLHHSCQCVVLSLRSWVMSKARCETALLGVFTYFLPARSDLPALWYPEVNRVKPWQLRPPCTPWPSTADRRLRRHRRVLWRGGGPERRHMTWRADQVFEDLVFRFKKGPHHAKVDAHFRLQLSLGAWKVLFIAILPNSTSLEVAFPISLYHIIQHSLLCRVTFEYIHTHTYTFTCTTRLTISSSLITSGWFRMATGKWKLQRPKHPETGQWRLENLSQKHCKAESSHLINVYQCTALKVLSYIQAFLSRLRLPILKASVYASWGTDAGSLRWRMHFSESSRWNPRRWSAWFQGMKFEVDTFGGFLK